LIRDAVVMAAGEGRRLRPLSERYAKPVLPIDGQPVLVTLLHELRTAGLAPITVVTGHLAEQVEALVGDGSGFGLAVTFTRQPGVLGSADAVHRGLAAGAEPPFLVAAADTVFEPGDVSRFAAAAEHAAGGLAVRRVPAPDPPHRWGTRVENGRVVAVLDRERTSDVSGAPLWSIGAELVPYLEGLSGPPYELADAYERAVEAGLVVVGFEIGRTRDLTHPADLVRENFPYLGS
jgi:glucose-1-phosphate thymidylyltransferase